MTIRLCILLLALTTVNSAKKAEVVNLAGLQKIIDTRDGTVKVINFWATWCGPCREEMPLLDRTRGQNGLEVVGIAVDDASAVKDYLKENPVGYPILIGDDDGNPELLFGDTRSVLPYSVLIGKDGKLLAQRAGSFTPELLHTWLSNNLKQVQ